jgi:hypothetical protein
VLSGWGSAARASSRCVMIGSAVLIMNARHVVGVGLYGGSLEAGSLADDSFRVHARLPAASA